jgi:hypothetical protein
MNFLWLLLVSIEHRESLTVFSLLVEKYKASLNRDPAYLSYLDKIGQNFFGLPAPQRQQRPGGMFSGLFDSFFRDEDDKSVHVSPFNIRSLDKTESSAANSSFSLLLVLVFPCK